MPFHYLDDFFQGCQLRCAAGLERALRFFNGLNRRFHLQTLFQQHAPLQAERGRQVQIAPAKQVLDLPERQADELERDDLLQPREV
ncbi:MAG TPA: hypothetical protein VF938_00190, partial [Candidatus Angelobacter sp.]